VSGTSVDSQGATVVTWTLTQDGAQASGTVTTRAPDPLDGSCNACHRDKSGSFSGTIVGRVLAMDMRFAAGVDGDPTPLWSAIMTGSASSSAADSWSAPTQAPTRARESSSPEPSR